jgi:hypothetical protein
MIRTLAAAGSWAARQARRAWAGAAAQAASEAIPTTPPVFVRACVVNETTRQRRTPVRAAFLSPYVADTLAEDVEHTGPGACLRILITSARPSTARSVYQAFANVRRRGVEVEILRDAGNDHRCPPHSARRRPWRRNKETRRTGRVGRLRFASSGTEATEPRSDL